MDIRHYADKRLGKREIRGFCREVFRFETERRSIANAKLTFFPLPARMNGMLFAYYKEGEPRCKVLLNWFSCIRKNARSMNMTLYYLYNTIVHELRHIELLDAQRIHTYAELMAHYEETYTIALRRPIDFVYMLPLNKKRKTARERQYQTSYAEVLCNLEGYTTALEAFRGVLPSEKVETLETVVDALKFLRSHIAITYNIRNHPYNSFVLAMHGLQSLFRRKEKQIKVTSLAQMLFDEKGQLKTMPHIAKAQNVDEAMIDDILVNLFIVLDTDFSEVLESAPELKARLTRLANAYCEKTVQFIQNQKLGEVFLNEDVLQGNAAMLIMNADRLNQLMDKYGMERTGGGVIPLYTTDVQQEGHVSGQ